MWAELCPCVGGAVSLCGWSCVLVWAELCPSVGGAVS